MSRVSISLLTGSTVLLLSALTVSAQAPQESRPERPYRGVYAGGTDQSEQVLTVNGSVGGGYDTNARMAASEAGAGGSGVPLPSPGSPYDQFAGGLSYTASLEKFSAGASASSSLRHYPQLAVPVRTSHAASGAASLSLGRNTRVNGGGSVTYQSTRSFTPFPELGDAALGQIEAPALDYGTGRGSYYTLSTNAGLTQQLGRRSSLALSYDRQNNQFANGLDDLMQQSGAVRYTHGLSRYFGLRLGYGYTHADFGPLSRPYEYHNLDTGLDYSRDLSISRRTKLSFSTGASAVQQGETTRFDIIGSATLNHEIGRTWNASLSYRRNGGFVEAVRAPIFYDGLSAGVDGLITRSLSFRSGIGATLGHVGIVSGGQNANAFNTWTGYAGLNAALTRNLALGVNYTYYRYSFEQGALLVTPLTPESNRQSVNVTLNAWAPVFQHGRKKTNATR